MKYPASPERTERAMANAIFQSLETDMEFLELAQRAKLEQVSHLWSYSRMKNCQKKWFFLATICALL